MSAVAILQETLPFDFEADTRIDERVPAHLPRAYDNEARQADVELCKSYFFHWASTFGSGRQANQPITFVKFQAAAKRLAQ